MNLLSKPLLLLYSLSGIRVGGLSTSNISLSSNNNVQEALLLAPNFAMNSRVEFYPKSNIFSPVVLKNLRKKRSAKSTTESLLQKKLEKGEKKSKNMAYQAGFAEAKAILLQELSNREKDLETVSAALKRTGCSMVFRYAIETFADRFVIDASFSVEYAINITEKIRSILHERRRKITYVVEMLCHATALKREQAKQKVSYAYVTLKEIMIDTSSVPEDESGLKNALYRFFTAKNEKEAFKRWAEDRENVWAKRLYFLRRIKSKKGRKSTKVSTSVSATPSHITDQQTSASTTISSTVIQLSTTSQGVQLEDDRKFMVNPGDKETIDRLSTIPYSVAANFIDREKCTDVTQSFVLTLASVIHMQPTSVTKQFVSCQWVLYTRDFHTAISPLFEFIQKHWVDESDAMKVVRFCSKFDLFWKLSSNKRIEMPMFCKLGTEDYEEFLTELGEGDEDFKIVGEGLLIHFNRTRSVLSKDTSTTSTSDTSIKSTINGTGQWSVTDAT